MRPPRAIQVALLVAALARSAAVHSAPLPATEPAPGDVVATQLLPRALKQSLRTATKSAAPSDTSLRERVASAQRMIETGRISGDPRTLGYAESLLAPWPADAERAPPEAVLLHATIAQSRHAFARATTLLDRVLDRTRADEPAHAQALLTRATIGQVTGRLDAARADCRRLVPLARDIAAVCLASVGTVGGETDTAIALLHVAVARTSGPVRGWALAVLAQAHEQRGERQQAAAAYRDALAASEDLVTRMAYADFLLAGDEPAAAARAVTDAPETDGVLLRRWRAARAANTQDAPVLEARLATRLADARQRGDGSDLLHARDWAWFELERGDISEALRFARTNWRDQREPADALVLARAASAARDRNSLQMLQAWIAQTKLQDGRLAAAMRETPR
jgi:tetratricopeptide (TPR) repeat protein